MNRARTVRQVQQVGVPRMRGDEPDALAQEQQILECSPHARG